MVKCELCFSEVDDGLLKSQGATADLCLAHTKEYDLNYKAGKTRTAREWVEWEKIRAEWDKSPDTDVHVEVVEPTSTPSGSKDKAGKVPWHLLPWDAAEAVVRVLAFGAYEKPREDGSTGYGERNWERGMSYSDLYAATQRHLKAWYQDREDYAEDSKLQHLAHAACDVLFLLAYELRGKGTDDRPGSGG